MYKQASKLNLMFQTSKGLLNVNSLWTLSLKDLKALIVSINKKLKETEEDSLDFLDGDSKVDPILQLQFDICKDVYLTKKQEAEALSMAKSYKEEEQKLLTMLKEHEEAELKNNPELIKKKLEELRKSKLQEV